MNQDDPLIFLWRPARNPQAADAELESVRVFPSSGRRDWLRDEVEKKAARHICLPHMRARLKLAIAERLLRSRAGLRRFRVNRRPPPL